VARLNSSDPPQTFRHEALLYRGEDDFVLGTAPFVREGLDRGEPVMVAVVPERIRILRETLGPAGDEVAFVDMEELGRNPARIIPAWRRFLDEHRGAQRVRGIGEPIWAGREPEEVVECQLHEALLDLALEPYPQMHLRCPYDAGALDDGVLHEARCSHATVIEGGDERPSAHHRAGPEGLAPFAAPLPPPRAPARSASFDGETVREARHLARGAARDAGVDGETADGFALAVHEIATNSVVHGGGLGVLRLWSETGRLIAEIRDRGRLEDPLAGRRPPTPTDLGGWGIFLANQLCDLVQLRSGPGGTVVRLSVRVP
jgi:anti-sigma regulatory factor (Ser/Thr protein kinase)